MYPSSYKNLLVLLPLQWGACSVETTKYRNVVHPVPLNNSLQINRFYFIVNCIPTHIIELIMKCVHKSPHNLSPYYYATWPNYFRNSVKPNVFTKLLWNHPSLIGQHVDIRLCKSNCSCSVLFKIVFFLMAITIYLVTMFQFADK